MTLELVFIEKIWMELLESADIPCFLIDQQGHLVDSNQKLTDLLRHPVTGTERPSQFNLLHLLGITGKHLQRFRNGMNEEQKIQIPVWLRTEAGKQDFILICRQMQVQVDESILYYGLLLPSPNKTGHQQEIAHDMYHLGQLTQEIIHNFEWLHTTIQYSADTMNTAMDDQNPLYPDIQAIRLAVQNAADLTQQLKFYMHEKNIPPKKSFSANHQIRALLKLINQFIPKKGLIEFHLDAPKDQVVGDAVWLNQILFQLLMNARDVISGNGLITLQTRNVNMIDEMPQKNSAEIKGKDCLYIQIKDTGPGLNYDERQQIFTQFYSTKPDSAGLGLSIVKENMERLGGRISVTSQTGKGTTFHLYLPIVPEQ